MKLIRDYVLLCTVLVASVASACRDDDGDRQHADTSQIRSVADTVGDTLVVRTVGLRADSSRVRLNQEIAIGNRSSDELFASIAGVRPTPDGGVFLSDGRTQAKLFDSSGNFVRDVGGKGSGPGEFSSALMSIAVAPAGQLLTWDRRGVTVFRSDGSYERLLDVPASKGQFVDSANRIYLETTIDDPMLRDSIVQGRKLQRRIA